MPARHRAWGAAVVMPCPAKTTAPRSGRRRPVIRLSAVVLPGPFGPMTPSASRSPTARVSPSMTRSDPNALETFSSASSAAISGRDRSRLADGPELPGDRDAGRRLVADHHHVEPEVLAAHPLPADERGLGDVGHRPLAPADRAHHPVAIGGLDRGDHRALV